MSCFKVAILDDNEKWIEALKKLLSRNPCIQIAGVATTQAEAVEIAKTHLPDLFLVDINLGHSWQNGISATIRIKEICDASIIVLSETESQHFVLDAFAVGISEYIPKSKSELLLPAIQTIMNSEFSPIALLSKHYAELRRENISNTLTPQEKELANLLTLNYTREDLQTHLHKSENTIKSQIRSILNKLGVTRTKAAVKKLKNGGVLFPEDLD